MYNQDPLRRTPRSLQESKFGPYAQLDIEKREVTSLLVKYMIIVMTLCLIFGWIYL